MSWLPKKSVVVPVDFSPASLAAIQTALQLVDQPSYVHVVHVTAPPQQYLYGEFPRSVDPIQWEQHAAEYLTKFVKEQSLGPVTLKVLLGDAGTRIADYATEVHADLIVISSHGYHGLQRLLLGSVAERVLRHAPCEVLVLRRP